MLLLSPLRLWGECSADGRALFVRRGWVLKKEGAEAWARVWCQSDNSRSINFFESNVAGKGEGRCGELVVTEIEEASLPAAEAAGHPIAGSATVRTATFTHLLSEG